MTDYAITLGKSIVNEDSGDGWIDKLVVHYHEETEDGYRCGFTVAGVDRAEHLSVLEIAKFKLLEDWFHDR